MRKQITDKQAKQLWNFLDEYEDAEVHYDKKTGQAWLVSKKKPSTRNSKRRK